MAAQVLRSEVEEPPKISKDETGLPIITGWLSRQVKQGEKFVPRFLKTKDKVLCSFQKDPSKVAMGEEAPRVPQPIGHAYNTLGIPGDGSPPARFIRGFCKMVILSRFVVLSVSLTQKVSLFQTCGAIATCTRRPPLSTPR